MPYTAPVHSFRARAIAHVSLVLVTLALAACGGDEEASAPPATTAATPATGELAGVKSYLLDHTEQLDSFTQDFESHAEHYFGLAEDAGFDYASLWSENREELTPLLSALKASWIEGNPAYEQMEGVVAGVSELSKYDVILDAGSSAAEDPASAVPFDLELPDGRTLEQPGNLFNLTEGALWVLGRSSRRPVWRPMSTATAPSSSARRCPTRTCSSPRPARSPSMRASSKTPHGRGSRATATPSLHSS